MITIHIFVKNTLVFNMTNLNNIVFFSFCRSLYRYITTVYIFCQTEAANLHTRWKFPIKVGSRIFPSGKLGILRATQLPTRKKESGNTSFRAQWDAALVSSCSWNQPLKGMNVL